MPNNSLPNNSLLSKVNTPNTTRKNTTAVTNRRTFTNRFKRFIGRNNESLEKSRVKAALKSLITRYKSSARQFVNSKDRKYDFTKDLINLLKDEKYLKDKNAILKYVKEKNFSQKKNYSSANAKGYILPKDAYEARRKLSLYSYIMYKYFNNLIDDRGEWHVTTSTLENKLKEIENNDNIQRKYPKYPDYL